MTKLISDFKATWALLLPEATAPAYQQFALWLTLHDHDIVREGLAQLATKFRKLGGAMDADYRVKFASAVMNRLSREQKDKTT